MKRVLPITISLVIIALLGIYVIGVVVNTSTASLPQQSAVIPAIQVQSPTEKRSFTIADIAKTGNPQFLNAYATWCPYCQQNEPIVTALHQQFKDRVDFIHLNVDGEGVLEAAAPYTITGVTQYVLIDPEGKIIEKWFGTITEESLSESIAAYLQSA